MKFTQKILSVIVRIVVWNLWVVAICIGLIFDADNYIKNPVWNSGDGCPDFVGCCCNVYRWNIWCLNYRENSVCNSGDSCPDFVGCCNVYRWNIWSLNYRENSVCNSGDSCLEFVGCSNVYWFNKIITLRILSVIVGIVVRTLWVVAISIG